MDLKELKAKKTEIEAKISQYIYEVLNDAGAVPEAISIRIIQSESLGGDAHVAHVETEVRFGL